MASQSHEHQFNEGQQDFITTRMINRDVVAERLARGEVDWITFTSSSTVRNFLETIGPDRVKAARVRLASIGPTTSAALREAGLEPTVEATSYTIPGLVEAIMNYTPRKP